jgi:prealbumin domain-containing protein
MLVAGAASSILSNYQYVYAAAKNSTKSTSSSSSSKGGSGSSGNSTAPIGSKTFLTVTTEVSGGTSKPSDFTINVAGKSASPKSFPGSSGGTSVTLNTGKYKVTGSGPSGYTTKYSSGCSGTANGGVPMKCTVTASFSQPTPNPGARDSSKFRR